MKSTSWCPCSKSGKLQWDCSHPQQHPSKPQLHHRPAETAKPKSGLTCPTAPPNCPPTPLQPPLTSSLQPITVSHRHAMLQALLRLTTAAVQAIWHPPLLRQGGVKGLAGRLKLNKPALVRQVTAVRRQRCLTAAFWQTEGRHLRCSGAISTQVLGMLCCIQGVGDALLHSRVKAEPVPQL